MRAAMAVALCAAAVGYAVLASVAGQSGPWWLSWPTRMWDAMMRTLRPAPVVALRADSARIAELERELGIGVQPAERRTEPTVWEVYVAAVLAADEPEERPIQAPRTVCLTKNCAGDTEEVRLWSGQLARVYHRCEAP